MRGWVSSTVKLLLDNLSLCQRIASQEKPTGNTEQTASLSQNKIHLKSYFLFGFSLCICQRFSLLCTYDLLPQILEVPCSTLCSQQRLVGSIAILELIRTSHEIGSLKLYSWYKDHSQGRNCFGSIPMATVTSFIPGNSLATPFLPMLTEK